MRIIHFIFSLCFILVANCVLGQKSQIQQYDKFNDTLIVLGEIVIDKNKVYMDREDFLNIDSLVINQKGLQVTGFTMSALALGANVQIKSNTAQIGSEMKDVVTNEKPKYKFIYLKDILLYSSDGRKSNPSTKSVKIIFNN